MSRRTLKIVSRVTGTRRARLATGAAVALTALTAVAAFAYWTSSGEGHGEVTASSGGAGFEVTSSTVAGLYPSGNLAVTVKVKNKDENQPERLTKLEAEVEKTSKESEPEPCKKSWFVVSPASQEPKVVLAHGETKEYTVHLEMKEEATENQNGCKGAAITLKYKAS
jgi:hypothetical protein